MTYFIITYFLVFTIIPSIWQLATMPLCPESPKYLLISKGQQESARKGMLILYIYDRYEKICISASYLALVKLRHTSNVDNEFNAIQREANKIKFAPSVGY